MTHANHPTKRNAVKHSPRRVDRTLNPNHLKVRPHCRVFFDFDADGEDGFGSAVRQLIDDAAMRRRLGAGAQAAIDENAFTWDANAAKVVSLVEALDGRAPSEGTADRVAEEVS